jgi:hypothetical protein
MGAAKRRQREEEKKVKEEKEGEGDHYTVHNINTSIRIHITIII